jgi:signal transduction histidine kinase
MEEIKRKEIRFQRNIGENRIIANRDLLEKVLDNMIHNAIKFAPSHSTISLSSRNEPENFVFHISNPHEIHYSPEDKAFILKPFTQYDITDTRKYGGIGLGLFIIKNACQKMDVNWEININDQEFQIELELQRPPTA